VVLWLTILWVSLIGGDAAAPDHPIRVREIDRSMAAGPVRGWAAFVELGDPRIEVLVTNPLEGASPGFEAVPVPTNEWAERVDAGLAVNANFFGGRDGRLDIVGLCVSDGAVLSPPRIFEGEPDPALVFLPGGRADIERREVVDGVIDAVAGVGGSPGAAAAGSLLVSEGRATGETARVDPLRRHPRTAAGLTEEGRVLVLLVVDGRQPGWSVGMTLPELADLMVELGAFEAMNLDGGGSSSFCYRNPETGVMLKNRPSDGRFRGVACHLGFRVRRGAEAPFPRRGGDSKASGVGEAGEEGEKG